MLQPSKEEQTPDTFAKDRRTGNLEPGEMSWPRLLGSYSGSLVKTLGIVPIRSYISPLSIGFRVSRRNVHNACGQACLAPSYLTYGKRLRDKNLAGIFTVGKVKWTNTLLLVVAIPRCLSTTMAVLLLPDMWWRYSSVVAIRWIALKCGTNIVLAVSLLQVHVLERMIINVLRWVWKCQPRLGQANSSEFIWLYREDKLPTTCGKGILYHNLLGGGYWWGGVYEWSFQL